MGSQRVAIISEARSRTIRESMREVSVTPAPGTENVPPGVAANAIGPFSKTSPFVQCLSSASTTAGIKALIEFANRIKFSGEPGDDTLEEYGVNPKIKRPAGQVI